QAFAGAGVAIAACLLPVGGSQLTTVTPTIAHSDERGDATVGGRRSPLG
ncbi:MAG: hypothetical protein QOH89_194, partial [Pseudonocardiales bacterium]|nr:hypothetical protein [Pseudonocardiales bacterium]